MVSATGALAMVTVLVLWGPKGLEARRRLAVLPSAAPAGGPVRPPAGAVPALGGAVVTTAALLAGVQVLLLPTAALVTWAVATAVVKARRDEQAVRRRERVVDACEAMLGELEAGMPPTRALGAAAAVWPELSPVAGAGRLGGDVPAAMRTLAALPGAGALVRLAGAWQLCAATGSGLAGALDQVLGTVRAEHEVVLAVRAELAAARATARLLAVLPLVVLAMAQGIGADPWEFLLATVPGQLCLGAGTALAVCGVSWLERIADDAQGEAR